MEKLDLGQELMQDAQFHIHVEGRVKETVHDMIKHLIGVLHNGTFEISLDPQSKVHLFSLQCLYEHLNDKSLFKSVHLFVVW